MLNSLFQTSLDKTGSDAMNAAGDYSAAYCIIYTDSDYKGHGMVRRKCVISPPSMIFTNLLTQLPILDLHYRPWQ